MRPCAVLVITLALCSLGAAKDNVKSDVDKSEEEASRKGRFLFLSNLLTAPINAISQAVSGLTGIQKTVPPVVYVARQPAAQTCPFPLFPRGCPAGYVCASATGGSQCVPQYPEGVRCQSGFQCVSGVCRESYCVKDDCQPAGGPSNCPSGQECVSTKAGNRCQPKSDKDKCSVLLEQSGCPENQYCGSGTDGKVCKPKLQVGETCAVKVQCLSDNCRNRKCKADACPMVDMSIDCMPNQYCAPGENGNMCVAKKEKGTKCSAKLQCKSNVCDERGYCIDDKCPNPYMETRCLPTQFCNPAPFGNECMEKRNNNERCRQNAECKSGTCRSGVCKANDCQTPFSSEGCNMMTQFCMTTPNGNECVMKLGNDQPCMTAAQCMSGNCKDEKCSASVAGPQLANGASCGMPSQCASGNCVLEKCAASRNSMNGMCTDNDDCQSNSCVQMRCVGSAPATTASPVTVAPTPSTNPTPAPTPPPKKAVGEVCEGPIDCQSGKCFNTRCVSGNLMEIGQDCATNADCLSNNCNNQKKCAKGTVKKGDPCTIDPQCASNSCNVPICR